MYESSVSVLEDLILLGMRGSRCAPFAQMNVTSACNLLNYMRNKSPELPYSRETFNEIMGYVPGNAIVGGNLEACVELCALGCPLDLALPGCGLCSPLEFTLRSSQAAIVQWLLGQAESKRAATWTGRCEKHADSDPISLAVGGPRTLKRILKGVLRVFRARWREWLLGSPARNPILEVVSASNEWGLRTILDFVAEEMSNPQNCGVVKMSIAEFMNRPSVEMPMHVAAGKGNVPIMKLLQEYGASYDSQDGSGRTVLYHAAWNQHYDAVAFLLKSQANPDWPAPDLPSILHLAAKINGTNLLDLAYPYCRVSRSLDKFVGCRSPLAFCRSLKCVRWLEGHGFDLGRIDERGCAPLHCLLCDKEMRISILQTGLLGQHGLDRTRVNLEEPADWVIKPIFKNMQRLVRRVRRECALAIFSSEPDSGFSALCVAAEYGYLDCCRALVSLGVNLDFEGHMDGSALEVAIRYRRLAIVKYLIDSGASMVYYSRREGRYKSAFSVIHWYPQSYSEIYRWILVDRYTERRSIC
ncbi:ankyrin repeat-containing domain protein [Aspergillus heterothallicus]